MPVFNEREKRTTPIAGLTSAVAEIAKAMAQQHSSVSSQLSAHVPSSTTTTSNGVSPAKLADLRSNYLRQMRDLHSLFECGAITESEFLEQKTPILDQLKKMKPM